jgi:hypothetical protein
MDILTVKCLPRVCIADRRLFKVVSSLQRGSRLFSSHKRRVFDYRSFQTLYLMVEESIHLLVMV